jgi:lambda family phage holin
MPWKNLDPTIMAPIFAIIVSILRVVYDGKETRVIRIVLEAAICGLLTLAAGSAIRAMGLNDDWSMVAGGIIGFLGSEFVRYTAKRIVGQYTPKA